MAYGVIMLYHLHMPSYILRTFTEYPSVNAIYKMLSQDFLGQHFLFPTIFSMYIYCIILFYLSFLLQFFLHRLLLLY